MIIFAWLYYRANEDMEKNRRLAAQKRDSLASLESSEKVEEKRHEITDEDTISKEKIKKKAQSASFIAGVTPIVDSFAATDKSLIEIPPLREFLVDHHNVPIEDPSIHLHHGL